MRTPSTAQALVVRARIILAAAPGGSNQEIATLLGITADTVSKWRQRFLMFGLKGLTNWGHGGRPRKYGHDAQQRLRTQLRQPPPGGATRWTLDQLAGQLAVPRSSVHEMLIKGNFQTQRQPARRRRR